MLFTNFQTCESIKILRIFLRETCRDQQSSMMVYFTVLIQLYEKKGALPFSGLVAFYNLRSCAPLIMPHFSPVVLQGIGPRVLWIGIGGSIFFGVLEKTKQLLAHKRPPGEKKRDSLKLV